MSCHADNSIEKSNAVGNEGRLKQKRGLNKEEKTKESVKKDDDEIPTKLQKMNREEASETKSGKCLPRKLLSFEDVNRVMSDNPTPEQIIYCYKSLGNIFSRANPPPIADVVKSGLLTVVVYTLGSDNYMIQYGSLWVLNKFVSGAAGSEQASTAIEAGAIPPLVKLVLSDVPRLTDQALWTLSNIAEYSPQLRDCVIKWGLDAILQLVDRVGDTHAMDAQTLSWTLATLCRHRNVDSVAVPKLRTGLGKLLQHMVQHEAQWSLDSLTIDVQRKLDLENEEKEQALAHLWNDHEVPELRALSHCGTWRYDQMEQMMDLEVLEELIELSGRTCYADTVKEACSLISKVTEVTQNQIIDVGFVGFVANALATGDCNSHIEAVRAFLNLVQRGTSTLIYALVPEKVLPVLVKDLGEVKDARMQKKLLETICTCLSTVSNHFPEQMDDVRNSFEVAGGVKHLEQLQSSELLMIDSGTNKMIQIIKILLE